MSDNFDEDRTRRQTPESGTKPIRPGNSEIPRRGYDRTVRSTPPDTPPPVYDAPRRAGSPPPGRPQPPMRGRKRAPRDSGLYLPWWSLVILIVVVGGVAIGLLLVVANLSSAIVIDPTPRILVVTGQVQLTQPAANAAPPTGIPTTQATPIPTIATAEPSDTPIPGGCLLGEEVLVFNTGGVGLNLRDRPGGDVQFIAKEGEKLLVIDGPQYFDDIEWCQVRSTAQSSSFGWAALQFLLPADALPDE